jgi:hypothetical protein
MISGYRPLRFRPFNLVIATSFFLYLSFWLHSLRPVQDDYASLLDLRELGFLGSLKKVWNFYGAKFSSAVPAYLANDLKISGFPYFGLILLSFLSWVLVFSIVFLILRLQAKLSAWTLGTTALIAASISTFSFASILTPGLMAPYGFTWSSTTHLWPICLGVALYLLEDKINSWFFFPISFIIANANITEGIAAVSIFLFLTVLNYHERRYSAWIKYLVATFGSCIGILILICSPGFSLRASEVSSSKSFETYFLNLPKVSMSIFGDYVTHPIFFLGMIVGVYVSSNRIAPAFLKVCKALACMTILFLLISIAADSIAYVSWYHLTGIYPFSLFSGVYIGSVSKRFAFVTKRNLQYMPIVGLSCFTLLIALAGRDFASIESRSRNWDRNLVANICSFSDSKKLFFAGTSVVYPPLMTGITDGESRVWIAQDYRAILKSDIRRNQLNCVKGSQKNGL